jgi:ribonuclease HI
MERITNRDILKRSSLNDTIPIIIATDGGYDPITEIPTIGIAILEPDIRSDDIENEWMNRKAIPLLIRNMQLPTYLGTEKTSNNTAEILAILICIMSLPADKEKMILTDSEVAMHFMDNIFNHHKLTHRKIIREIGQGVGQSLTNMAKEISKRINEMNQTSRNFDTSYTICEKMITKWAEGQNKKDEDDSPSENIWWKQIHKNITLVKIKSHQTLTEYAKPNLFSASGNDLADKATNIVRNIDQIWKDNIAHEN